MPHCFSKSYSYSWDSMAIIHRRQSSLPYSIVQHIFGQREEVPIEEEAAALVDNTNSGRPESIAGNKPRVDKQKVRGHSTDKIIKADPDSKAGGKLQENGVNPLTCVLLCSNAKPHSCLYSIHIRWLEYLLGVAGLPSTEGLEHQAEEFGAGEVHC